MKKYILCFACLLASNGVLASPVNVNTASVEEISKALKGIGAKKAQAIVDLCQKKTCRQPEDLLMAKGIGSVTLESIRADLIFSVEAEKAQ